MIRDRFLLFCLFLFTPFGLFLFIRVILPFNWCIDFVSSKPDYQDIDVVYSHMVYLVVLLFGLIVIFKNFITTQKYIQHNSFKNEPIQNLPFPFILIFIIVAILLFTPLPLFHEGGSDATTMLQEEAKTSTWLFSGILNTLSLPLYFLAFYENNRGRKVLYTVLLIIIAISDGKKVGFFEFIMNVVLISSFIIDLKKYVKFKHIALFFVFFIAALFFGIYQYFKTLNKEITFDDFVNVFPIMYNLLTASFTSYLVQMHVLGGLDLIKVYHDQLGDFTFFNYFFNSYIKLLGFDGGIKKSIGPFLNYWIYGSDKANGVNPTLFYELIFITGKKYAGVISIFILPIIFYFILKCYKLLAHLKKINIYKMAIYIFLIKFWLAFLTDTLNAIRSIPFLILLILIYNFNKIKLPVLVK